MGGALPKNLAELTAVMLEYFERIEYTRMDQKGGEAREDKHEHGVVVGVHQHAESEPRY
ncbi:MAG: hypothetical protein LBK41_06900 [Clostridiales bacterium]|nr:hypothetical protein [Clostridiales bacterium]